MHNLESRIKNEEMTNYETQRILHRFIKHSEFAAFFKAFEIQQLSGTTACGTKFVFKNMYAILLNKNQPFKRRYKFFILEYVRYIAK